MPTESNVKYIDVLIVGGGPAGYSAAIEAQKLGLRVVLIDGGDLREDRPGESIPPQAKVFFESLGVVDEISNLSPIRDAGQWIRWNTINDYIPFHPLDQTHRGYQIQRSALRAVLFNRLLQLKGEAHHHTSLKSIVRVPDGYLATTSTDRYTARFLIDATGPARFLSKHLQLAVEDHSRPLIAHYGYFESSKETLIPSLSGDSTGWTWISRISDKRYAWVRLWFRELERDLTWRPSKEALEGKVSVANVTWKHMPDCAGERYFVVGDAACMLDPAAGTGVIKSMMSGILAGYLISEVLKKKRTELEVAKLYKGKISEVFLADRTRLEALYRALEPGF